MLMPRALALLPTFAGWQVSHEGAAGTPVHGHEPHRRRRAGDPLDRPCGLGFVRRRICGDAVMSAAQGEQCNRCRFWSEDMNVRDLEDPDFGFGSCRLKPPTLIDSLVEAQIERPTWGSGETPDDIMDTIELNRATRHPVTFATDWCGEFKLAHGLRP